MRYLHEEKAKSLRKMLIPQSVFSRVSCVRFFVVSSTFDTSQDIGIDFGVVFSHKGIKGLRVAVVCV